MKIKECKRCGKQFESKTSGCYCSDECRKKSVSKKSAEAQKAKRARMQICIDCGKEYPTRRGQTKYCQECWNKHYLCPICGRQKENIALKVCTNCSITERECPICGKHFKAKGVKKFCSDECAKKDRLIYYHNNKKLKECICNNCGKKFTSWDGNGHMLCKDCFETKHICPNCGGYKKASAKHCCHCSVLSRTYICVKCGKKCVGVKQSKFCDECYPRCKVCGKKCDTIYEECCSISCATKLKRQKEGTKEKLEKHLENMMSGLYSPGSDSKPNKYREDILTNAGLQVEREFRITNDMGYKDIGQFCFYDLKVNNYLIEIDPTASHNSSFGYNNHGDPKPKKYHQEKSLLGEAHGYHVIHIFDRDNTEFVKQRLIGLITKRKRLYSKDIRIVDAKEANDFCDRNHLQGKGPSTIRYGLYVNGELINLLGMLYQNGEWNLNRFCSKCGYYIAHGAEKLFKKFIQDFNPIYVVSFSDITKHSGGLYNALGFKLIEIQNPSYWRVNLKTGIPYWRRDCQKQAMHRLPGFNPEYKYIEHKDDKFWQQTEAQLMESHGYARVFDSGMRKHVRYNQDKQTN